MIGRQLHDEGCGLAREGLELLEDDAGDYDGDDADEVGAGGDPPAVVEERAGYHADYRQLRPAGDEAGGHDGHAPVALVFYRAAGHYGGDAAAGADEHGDEALAGEAELAEDAVHDEGDAGHVADVLKDGEHQEEQQHLRHEADDRADAGDDAVADEAHEPAGDAGALEPAARALDRPLGNEHVVRPVGEEGAERAHGYPVNQRHYHDENRQGQYAVGNDVVDLVRNGHLQPGLLFLNGGGHDAGYVGVALVGDDALGIVVHLFFAVGYVLLEVLHERAVELELLEHLFVALEHLDGVPAEEAPVDLALDALLDVGDGVLHAAVEDRGGDKFAVFPRELRCALRHGLGALAL